MPYAIVFDKRIIVRVWSPLPSVLRVTSGRVFRQEYGLQML